MIDTVKIVDAQIHLWEADRPDRPWPEYGHAFAHGPEMSATTVLAAMDRAGVDKAILVPPSWEGDRNEVCVKAARAYPDRFAVMGRFPLDRSMRREELENWMRQPGMIGIRLTFRQDFQLAWMRAGITDWIWPLAEELQVPVMVLAHGRLPEFRAIAERHPGLKLTLDHLALSGNDGDRVLDHLEPVLAFAEFPNVAVKATSLPNFTAEAYPFQNIQEVIRRTVAAFGPRRVFWGSDLTKLVCPLEDCIALFTEACDFLDAEDKRLIMGAAIADWIGWEL